jgi:hypothetical protein
MKKKSLSPFIVGIAFGALLAACTPKAEQSEPTAEQLAQHISKNHLVLLYLEGTAGLGCDVRIEADDFTEQALEERMVHVTGGCDLAPVNESAGLYIGWDENYVVYRVKGYRIDRYSGEFDPFRMTKDFFRVPQDLLSWFEDVAEMRSVTQGFATARQAEEGSLRESAHAAGHSLTVYGDGPGTAQETSARAVSASPEVGRDLVGGFGPEAYEGMCAGACCSCQGEYLTHLKQSVIASGKSDVYADAMANSSSAKVDAGAHCNQCSEVCAAMPRCETSAQCEELVVKTDEFCTNFEEVCDDQSGVCQVVCQEWATFDECLPETETAVFSCYSSELDKFTEEPAPAFALPAVDCMAVTLPGDVPTLPTCPPDADGNPVYDCEWAAPNQSECSCGMSTMPVDDAVCITDDRGSNANVCRPTDVPGVCTWQRTGLNNCKEAPAPEEEPIEEPTTYCDTYDPTDDTCGQGGACAVGTGTCSQCAQGYYNCNGGPSCESRDPNCDTESSQPEEDGAPQYTPNDCGQGRACTADECGQIINDGCGTRICAPCEEEEQEEADEEPNYECVLVPCFSWTYDGPGSECSPPPPLLPPDHCGLDCQPDPGPLPVPSLPPECETK